MLWFDLLHPDHQDVRDFTACEPLEATSVLGEVAVRESCKAPFDIIGGSIFAN